MPPANNEEGRLKQPSSFRISFSIFPLPSPRGCVLSETFRIPLAKTFAIFAISVAETVGAVRVEAEMIASVRAPSVQTIVVAVPLLAPLNTIIFEAIMNLAIAFFTHYGKQHYESVRFFVCTNFLTPSIIFFALSRFL